MTTERLSSLLLQIGRATRATRDGKRTSARSFHMVDGQHRFTASKAQTAKFTEFTAECLTKSLYSKYIHPKESYPTSMLQISKHIGYANRTLISAYCELGKGLELYDVGSAGRSALIATTPTFDVWEDLAEKRFKLIANLVGILAKQLENSPKDVRHSISELKQAFFISQSLERDPLAKRRYEIMADVALRAMIEPANAAQALKDIVAKLLLMEEMKGLLSEEILEGFTMSEQGGRVTLEWIESGSKEGPAEKLSKKQMPTISTGK